MNLNSKNQYINNLRNYVSDCLHSCNLYEISPTPYFTVNQDSQIINTNIAGAELFKIDRKILINSYLLHYTKERDKENLTIYLRSPHDELFPKPIIVQFSDGNGCRIDTRIYQRYLKNTLSGKKMMLLCIKDITIENLYKRCLEHHNLTNIDNDSFAIIEQFTSRFIHELSQPLSVINNYANGVIRRLNLNNNNKSDLIHAMKQILNMTDRINEIHHQLKLFKFKNNLSFQLIDIDDLIKKMLNLMQYEFDMSKIDLHYRPALHLPKLSLDKLYIEQVFLNILRNAIETMKSEDIIDPRLLIETDEGDDYINISFTDNGPKISEISESSENKLLDININNWIFSTQLALIISRTVIEAHGGKLSAISLERGGTSVKVTLPKIIPHNNFTDCSS